MIKHVANMITLLRVVFGAALVFTAPFSVAFWACYLGGGLSDILDGMCARRLHQQSETGAKLDSIADAVFVLALCVVVVMNIPLPRWTWGWIACIAGLKCVGYGIGAYKYHAFSALHTYANKIAGICLFTFPLLYKAFGISITGIFLCTVASVSALEELLITLRAKELDRNCKGLLFGGK